VALLAVGRGVVPLNVGVGADGSGGERRLDWPSAWAWASSYGAHCGYGDNYGCYGGCFPRRVRREQGDGKAVCNMS